MKPLFICLVFLACFLCNCTSHQQDSALQQKEDSLNRKAQDLLLKEKALQLKEEDLVRREQRLDSTLKSDSTRVVDSTLIGSWSVKMVCTETTCAGSAVGDTKNEQWSFSYQGTTLSAKAVANDTSARIYSGHLVNDVIELQQQTPSSGGSGPVSIRARLHKTDETHLEGQREIVREGECRLVYALTMQKQ